MICVLICGKECADGIFMLTPWLLHCRCKLHLVLHAMMQSTPLISYLQQMQQLLSQQATLQTNPMTHPLGSPYGGPVPMVPRAVQGGSSAEQKGQRLLLIPWRLLCLLTQTCCTNNRPNPGKTRTDPWCKAS